MALKHVPNVIFRCDLRFYVGATWLQELAYISYFQFSIQILELVLSRDLVEIRSSSEMQHDRQDFLSKLTMVH